jgi:hypothetical protein
MAEGVSHCHGRGLRSPVAELGGGSACHDWRLEPQCRGVGLPRHGGGRCHLAPLRPPGLPRRCARAFASPPLRKTERDPPLKRRRGADHCRGLGPRATERRAARHRGRGNSCEPRASSASIAGSHLSAPPWLPVVAIYASCSCWRNVPRVFDQMSVQNALTQCP